MLSCNSNGRNARLNLLAFVEEKVNGVTCDTVGYAISPVLLNCRFITTRNLNWAWRELCSSVRDRIDCQFSSYASIACTYWEYFISSEHIQLWYLTNRNLLFLSDVTSPASSAHRISHSDTLIRVLHDLSCAVWHDILRDSLMLRQKSWWPIIWMLIFFFNSLHGTPFVHNSSTDVARHRFTVSIVTSSLVKVAAGISSPMKVSIGRY
jgi:hypothetical protein